MEPVIVLVYPQILKHKETSYKLYWFLAGNFFLLFFLLLFNYFFNSFWNEKVYFFFFCGLNIWLSVILKIGAISLLYAEVELILLFSSHNMFTFSILFGAFSELHQEKLNSLCSNHLYNFRLRLSLPCFHFPRLTKIIHIFQPLIISPLHSILVHLYLIYSF